MKQDNDRKRILAARALPFALLALLTACGGGGDDGNTTNQKPVADAGDEQTVDARSQAGLSGSGTDSDGTIATYAWEQTAGATVTITAADTPAPTFTAPDVSDAEVLTFKLTVTDDGGKTASDTVDVTVAPAITLNGQVYDSPIANALVTVTVGDKSYTATADANGEYTLDIGAVDPNAFVTITATGIGEQENVELMSIAGSFGALSSAAGEGGILETSESGSVNITNLSTAKAVLMIAANGGEDITDDAMLATSESLVSGDDLLYLATVIKLVVDGGYDLPAGTNSTLELIKDATKTTVFVAAVDLADPAAFETIYEEIISDPKLVTAFTADNVPAELFTLFVSSNNDKSLTYRVTNRGKAWTFNANGTGTRSDADFASEPFTWTTSNGSIVVTYNTPLETAGNCTHPDDNTGFLYYCESTTTKTSFTLVVDGVKADTLLLSNTGETIYPSVDDGGASMTQPIAMTGGSTNLGLQKSAAIPFTEEEVPGRWVASTTGRADASVAPFMYSTLDSGIMEFNADGSGERMAVGESLSETFAWSVTDGVLKVTYAGGDVVSYYRMRRDGNTYDTLALLNRFEGKRHSDAGLMLEVDVARLPLLELEDVPGRYSLFEMQNSFNIRMNENGTGANENFDNDGASLGDGNTFSWELRGDYSVEMRYYWDPNPAPDGSPAATCLDASTCHNWMDRLWYPAAYDDATGRVYVLEIQQYYDWDDLAAESKGALLQYQPSVRYFGRTELTSGGGVLKSSAPASAPRVNRMAKILGTPMTNGR